MGKAKTLQKPEKFKGPSIQPTKLSKKGSQQLAKLETYSPTENLADPNFMFEAVIECLVENDLETLKELIRAHYEAINITQALKRVKLSQRTFFEAVSPKGNPSLKTFGKLIHGIATEPRAQVSMNMKAKA